MKNHFLRNLIKVSAFFSLCTSVSFYAMKSEKNNKSAEERFLSISFPMVYDATKQLDNDYKESILQKITQGND